MASQRSIEKSVGTKNDGVQYTEEKIEERNKENLRKLVNQNAVSNKQVSENGTNRSQRNSGKRVPVTDEKV